MRKLFICVVFLLTLLLVSPVLGCQQRVTPSPSGPPSATPAMSETGTIEPGAQTQIIKSVTPDKAAALIESNRDNPGFVIIDVRTPEEFAEEHIEDAVNVDHNSEAFRDDLDKLDKNGIYAVYCRTGRRSWNAAELMRELGFREVYDIGGITVLKGAGLPTII